jgi:hypothetical protein
MKRTEFLSGAGLFVIALLTLFVVIPWQIDEAEGYLSPRLVPQIAISLVAFLAALQAFNALRGIQSSGVTPFRREELIALAKIAAVFALSLALFKWVAPLAAGVALTAGFFIALGERRPLLIVLATAGLLLAVWLVFYRLVGTTIG